MGKKILVIDDDAAVRGAFKLILGEAGYDVREAEDGLQGIEMVKASRPDLIFLDLKMPGIDGVETLRRLKEVDATLNVYIATAFAIEYMSQLKAAHDAGLQFELASKPLSSSQIRHIAQTTIVEKDVLSSDEKISLTLYVVLLTAETRKLVAELNELLAQKYAAGCWSLNVIEVMHMPELALEKEVFATPMLVRELPSPVLKLLGDLSKASAVMAAITVQHNGDIAKTMIV